jgi:hypothetical protein
MLKNIFTDRHRFQGLYIKTRTALLLKVNFIFGTGINIWYNYFFLNFFLERSRGGGMLFPLPTHI